MRAKGVDGAKLPAEGILLAGGVGSKFSEKR